MQKDGYSVNAEQIKQLFLSSHLSGFSSFLLGLLLVICQRNHFDSLLLAGWLGCVFFASAARAIAVEVFQRKPLEGETASLRRLNVFRALVVLSGVIWGTASFLLFPANFVEHQMVLVVIVIGLVSGAIVSFSADLFCSVAFSILVLVPLATRLLSTEHEFSFPIGFGIAFYILFMLVNARRIHLNSNENIRLRMEAVQRELELRESEQQLRMVLEGAELGFWDWDMVAGTIKRNERWANMLGYTNQEIQQATKNWEEFIHPDDREKARQSIKDVVEGRLPSHKIEYRMLHKDGSIVWIRDQAKVVGRDTDGNPVRMSGTHNDITERKQLELELKRQAHIDYLTDVSNRGYFMEQAEFELNRAVRYQKNLSLVMLDIDHFKQINDTYGHKAGDLVLKKLADVCRETLREVDIVGRLGG